MAHKNWKKDETPINGTGGIHYENGSYYTSPDENGDTYCCGHIDYFKVYLKQAGGSYCQFACPSCGYPKAEMKISSNYGHCDGCGLLYQMLGEKQIEPGPPENSDYYCDLEIVS